MIATSAATKSVSVVVPTFNRGNYIEECVDSILGQTIPPFELIVVDDGSTDDTAQRLARYGSRIKYLFQRNAGKAAALNFAMPSVIGAYVWFFDDDDVALPDAIEQRLRFLESHDDVAFVSTSHFMGSSGVDGKIRIETRYSVPIVDTDALFFELMKGCYFTFPSVLVRTQAIRDIGGFDEALTAGQDYDIMLRLAQHYRGASIDVPTFIVRQHAGDRGPLGQRYQAQQRQAVFMQYERLIGSKLRNSVFLGQFLVPKRDGTLTATETRQALCRRMLVMGSKGLIQEMMSDLVTALKTTSGQMSKAELDLCSTAIQRGFADIDIKQYWKTFLSSAREMAALPGGRRAVASLAWGFLVLAKSYPGSVAVRIRRGYSALATLLTCASSHRKLKFNSRTSE